MHNLSHSKIKNKSQTGSVLQSYRGLLNNTIFIFIYIYIFFFGLQNDLSSDGSVDDGRNSDSDSDAGGVRRDGGSGERDPLDRRETLACDRMQGVMTAMEALVGSRLEYRSVEKLLSCASRMYRAITKVCTEKFSFFFLFFLEKLYIAV